MKVHRFFRERRTIFRRCIFVLSLGRGEGDCIMHGCGERREDGYGGGKSVCGAYGGRGAGDSDECVFGAGAGDQQPAGAGGGPDAGGGPGTGGARAWRLGSSISWTIPTAGAGRLRKLGGAAYGVADADATAGEGAARYLWFAGIVCYRGAGVRGGIACDILWAADFVSGDGGAGAAGGGSGGGGIGVGMRVDGA